jgi:histidyl-tRNA synthetase
MQWGFAILHLMALSTQPYKGARDFYPDDKRLQKYLFGVMRSVVEKFGYEEYDAPILEPLELYAAKTGQEIVDEQTYTFEDRGGRHVAIRPEMTPTVSRMVAGRRQELAYPLRLYNIGGRWRYERPQRGRYREFYQLDVDLFGVAGLAADHEIIQVADSIMHAYGATREMYTIKLNSRKLMDFLLREYLQLSEVQAATLSKLIDHMHKMEHAAFVAGLDGIFTISQREKGLSEALIELLKVKNLEDLPKAARLFSAATELQKLMDLLAAGNVTNAEFDITLMRGFDYYSDIVFEVFDTDPQNNRAMFGGGRYDGLVGLFGVEPVPTVGFAMGDATLQNFLESHELLPKPKLETDLYVVLIGDVHAPAQQVVQDLREMGLNVAVDISGRAADKQIKSADKKGIPYVLFIGNDELKDEQFKLKNLATSKEETHSLQRIVSIVKDFRTQ